MDLSFLIPSKVRRAVLQYFVENPEARVYVRELARVLKRSPQVVYRELLNLEGWGFLFSSAQANQRVFRLNPRFPLYPPVSDLYRRLKEENARRSEVIEVLDWEKLRKKYGKIPIPPDLIKGLTAKRVRPRAWAEEKALKRKGML